jgi:hypothetical protein
VLDEFVAALSAEIAAKSSPESEADPVEA